MEEKRKISTTYARVGMQGEQKILTIPKSIEEIQAGDEVLIIKMNLELLKYLKELVKEDFINHNVKMEWTDYLQQRRFS